MGTLREIKREIKKDKDLRGLLVRSDRHEILLDLDGDRVADIGLIDSKHNGEIDTLAFDVTGSGEFNLYFHDQDDNGVPDVVLWGDDESETLEVLGCGKDVEAALIDKAIAVMQLLAADTFLAGDFLRKTISLNEFVETIREQLPDGVDLSGGNDAKPKTGSKSIPIE